MNSALDFERARFNMVEQQIRTWDVLDQEVLDLLFTVRREDFVPVAYRALAFADMEIPIGFGQKMMAPKMEARIVQALDIRKTDHILEVGTGSGYLTALLANCAQHVHSVEIIPELSRDAAARLAAHGIANVTLEVGDAARGWARHGPYDAIAITGSVPVLPDAFKALLKPGGRLFAVVGDAPAMEARLVTCVAAGAYNVAGLFETCIDPLQNALQPERFEF